MEVGIREMRNHFSGYLIKVKKGETLIITERNIPIAKLMPLQKQVPAEISNLVSAGLVSWKGGKPKGLAVLPEGHGTKTMAEIVMEDRQ
ncbi:MAG: type II toxin-antitoxin system prevent-host-death family antitoxin [Desulfotomaculum sp.]|nr:type II toxin-antitoxin system prevent-host-death family antitoxin [Desulfotomaculum sp.]